MRSFYIIGNLHARSGTAHDVTVGGSFAEPASTAEALWLPGGGPSKYHNGADTIVEIDPRTGGVMARWDVGSIGYVLEADKGSVWFFGRDGIELLDMAAGQ
jgi:hypothetical protein